MNQVLYYRYWGKARPDAENGDGPTYHLLPYHCLDVAAVVVEPSFPSSLLGNAVREAPASRNR